MIVLVKTNKGDDYVRALMRVHYSQPKGFVGRQIIYRIEADGVLYGAIAWGSAVKNLAGRKIIGTLQNGLNNTFFHATKRNGRYPARNFTTQVVALSMEQAARDYEERYGDEVTWFETLVELPRTGELYKRCGFKVVGQTKGFTIKRIGGESTDTWTGRRVWNTEELRPKLVLVKRRSSRLRYAVQSLGQAIEELTEAMRGSR